MTAPADSGTATGGAAVPQHLGIILDGNRRWAGARGLSPVDGHRAGFARIPEVLGWCEDAGIGTVTLWMLSTENMRRAPAEVAALESIIYATVEDLRARGRWRLNRVGVPGHPWRRFLDPLDRMIAATAGVDGPLANLAVCYGGKQEIVDACRTLLSTYASARCSPADAARRLTAGAVSEVISNGVPAPDLVIRTSGEQRTSGFLLWSGMHTEYAFTSVYWPDFSRRELSEALAQYRTSSAGHVRATAA
ncbi:hypothetical protein A6A06_01780 [Streptomyces sp. CB02923]|uniref:polyprenyl diphosphate synthase n=1 Tax=Streptomyces sp. CB02923 TaxID=1718985 RepID=UPI00093A0828|nr:polyprenyl diphosphate synthase [Streptomyces sp. CB02923]OKI09456.1 hypothetical protein A6A06_01780 [Streptomyces sp. CB02923]